MKSDKGARWRAVHLLHSLNYTESKDIFCWSNQSAVEFHAQVKCLKKLILQLLRCILLLILPLLIRLLIFSKRLFNVCVTHVIS